MRYLFNIMGRIGIESRIGQCTTFALIFIAPPTYLLGQTVPLLSNYFGKDRLSKITGRILFFSTLGSFLGAIVSTLILMPYVGVHNTLSLNFIIAFFIVLILNKNKSTPAVLYAALIAALSLFLNSNTIMRKNHIVKNNQYNTIQVGTIRTGDRLLKLNGNASTTYNDLGQVPIFISLAEELTLSPEEDKQAPKDILVVGAGGFTYGHKDPYNNYTYIDIDPDLQGVSEQYLLKEPIGENKQFIAEPARAYLNQNRKKFDIIFVDVHLGAISIPEHLVTYEFFMQLKETLSKEGIIVFNMILSPNFQNAVSRNIDTTMRAVFPYISRQVLRENYNLRSNDENLMVNTFYIYRHIPEVKKQTIYTDQNNTLFRDKPPIAPN